MSDGYKLKIHTHSPKAVEKLIGSNGLEQLLHDTIGNISKNLSASPFIPVRSPFSDLSKLDFDLHDPLVDSFFKNNDIVKIIKLPEIGRAHV